MRDRKKILIGVGGVVVMAIFVALALRQGQRGGIDVRTEKVQRRDLVEIVSVSGRVRPHRSVDIQADVSGRIVALHVDEGNAVERGDTLLRIDPTTFRAEVQRARAALSSARASVAQARANRDQARRNLERTRKLKSQNPDLISDEQQEAAETNFQVQEALHEAAQHQVQQAQASLREALDRLAKTLITAPMAGRVVRLNVEEGETAIVGTMNNPGTVLLTIADLSGMEAAVEVDETDVPRIEVGDSASVEIDAFPETAFAGRVTEIAHSSIQGASAGLTGRTSDQSVDFEVIIRLDDPPRELRTDLSATADIVTAVRDSVLSVPIIALTLAPESEKEPAREPTGQPIALVEDEPPGREGVFIVQDDNTVAFRPVKIGIVGGDYFEVVEGLEEGETIVSGSYQAIRELETGSLVKPTGEPASNGRETS